MADDVMTSSAPTGVSDSSSAPTSSTPATTTETPVAPVSTAPETVTLKPGEDEFSFLKRGLEASKVADAAKPPETVEAKPAEVKPEEKPSEVKPEEVAEDPETPAFGLDEVGPLPPKELAAKLKADPELNAKLEAAGIKEQVFQNARLASKAIKFQEVFPNIEVAQYARQQAETFGQLDDHFTSIRTGGVEAVDRLMGEIMKLDMEIGDDGKPVIDPATNQPKLQGNAQAFISTLGELALKQRAAQPSQSDLAVMTSTVQKHFEQLAKSLQAKNADDEKAQEYLAVAEVLKAASSGPASAKEELPPHLKAEADRIKAESDALARQRETQADADHWQREDEIGNDADKAINSEIETYLKQTDLQPERHARIAERIRDAVAEQLKEDKLFTSQRDWIMRAKWSPAVKQQRVALLTNSMRDRLPTIAKQVLKEEGATILKKQAARQQQIDTQLQAGRSEPKASGAASPPQPPSMKEIQRQVRDEYVKQHGDQPEALYLLTETRKRAAQLGAQ